MKIPFQMEKMIANRYQILLQLENLRQKYPDIHYITLNVNGDILIFDEEPMYQYNAFIGKRQFVNPVFASNISKYEIDKESKDTGRSLSQIIIHPLVLCALLYNEKVSRLSMDFRNREIQMLKKDIDVDKNEKELVTYSMSTAIYFLSTRYKNIPLDFPFSINLSLIDKIFCLKPDYTVDFDEQIEVSVLANQINMNRIIVAEQLDSLVKAKTLTERKSLVANYKKANLENFNLIISKLKQNENENT